MTTEYDIWDEEGKAEWMIEVARAILADVATPNQESEFIYYFCHATSPLPVWWLNHDDLLNDAYAYASQPPSE